MGTRLSVVIHQLLSLLRGGKKGCLLWELVSSQHINLSKPEAFEKVCSIPSHRPIFKLIRNRKTELHLWNYGENICYSGPSGLRIMTTTTVHLMAAVHSKQREDILPFCDIQSVSILYNFKVILGTSRQTTLRPQKITCNCWRDANNSALECV